MAVPTLNLAPDVQARYNQAMADPTVANNPQAVQYVTQQAQQQSQKEQASQPAPQAQQSSPGGFLSDVGSFFKNNLPTIGAIALPALADVVTGGLAIPADAALAGAGGAIGEVGKQAASGQGVLNKQAGINDLEQGGINAGASLVGSGLAKLAGGAASALGGLFGKEADDTAVQSLGLGQGNRNTFFKKTGQSVSDFMKSEGLAGANADTVKAAQDTLQDEYNGIARTSGIKVPVADVRNTLLNNLSGLINDDTDEGKAALATTVQKFENLFGSIPKDADGNVDIGVLTNQKANVQSATKSFSDSTAANTQANQVISKTLKDAVNAAADKEGLLAADGSPLSAVGQRLNKFNTLTDIISSKEPGQVGTSMLTKVARNTALPLASAAGGDKVGGVPGAIIGGVGGLIGDAAMGNPGVVSAYSGLIGKAGDALENLAAPSLAKTVGTNAVAQGVTGAAENGSGPAPVPQPLSAASSSVPSTPTLDSDPLQSAIAAFQAGQPLSTAQYAALEEATAANPKIQAGVTAAYNASNPSAVQGLAAGSSTVDQLQSLFDQAGGGAGGAGGTIKDLISSLGTNAYGTVKSYNNIASGLAEEIVNQVYGGAASDSQQEAINNLIPKITDTQAQAAQKIAQLKATIQNARLGSLENATASNFSSTPSLSLTP